jgi:hypothetical protein
MDLIRKLGTKRVAKFTPTTIKVTGVKWPKRSGVAILKETTTGRYSDRACGQKGQSE